MNYKPLSITIIVAILIIGCGKSYHKKKRDQAKRKTQYKENLVKANRGLVSRDSSKIVGVIRARNWNMQATETGLWYEIIEKGRGIKAQPEYLAEINYNVKLLSGKIVYTSDSTGPLRFKITKGGVERGLEEGILLLHQGDSARFIMPPYMAHHLLGDQKKIPPRSTIMYEVRLKSLKK